MGKGEDREEGRGRGGRRGKGAVVYYASMWMRCYYTAYSGIYVHVHLYCFCFVHL